MKNKNLKTIVDIFTKNSVEKIGESLEILLLMEEKSLDELQYLYKNNKNEKYRKLLKSIIMLKISKL